MIAALCHHMAGWFRAHLMAPARRQPLRAAVLDTGELVLVDAHGNAQVLSVETTEIVRNVLDASADIHPPVFPEATGYRHGVTKSDEWPLGTPPEPIRRVRAAGAC